MLGTGLPEFILILLVVVLLFGPAVLTFWLGYLVGRTKPTGDEPKPRAKNEGPSRGGSEENIDE